MFDTPYRRRGRGAQSNRSGRFESTQRVDIDDGWQVMAWSDSPHSGSEDDHCSLGPNDFQSRPDAEAPTTLRTHWRPDKARRVITRNQSPDVHFDQSINPYRGCEHGCAYCFARPSHTFLGHSAGLDFERRLYAKLDAAVLLRQELASPRYRCKPLAIGVNTDAYQPLERQLGLTRQILEVLLECRHPAYLITKSSLIERDLDLLVKMADRNLVTVSISMTTLDNTLSHRLEPRAAAPHRRLRTMRTLAEAGVPVRASVSPVIPALNEHEMDAILEASALAGASGANAIVLRLPHELAELFPEWLEACYPLKKERVLKAIRSLRSGKLNNSDFASRFSGEGPRADIIRQRFESACRRHGLASGRGVFTTDVSQFRAPSPPMEEPGIGQQMPLF
ncbi:PA0069 family radical SAM protein [Granulosicoccus sp. 3-233]|uniref:PA0069 family radical SAM protein n=1 Tax=Granulosicoccus sp. 3-233 TaxID=3417969 RepID=UPI003D33EC86